MRYIGLLLVASITLTACATKVAEFRNPSTGEVGRCIPNQEAVVMGAIGMIIEGDRYAGCKTHFEKQGYVRTPAGQESEETKQLVRDTDAARAASISKQGSVPVYSQASRGSATLVPIPPPSMPAGPTQSSMPAGPTPSGAPGPTPSGASENLVIRRPPSHPTPAWILGEWDILKGQSGSIDGVGRFHFTKEGSELKWRMVRSGWFSGVQTTHRASGVVKNISESVLELTGKYDSSSLGNVVGRIVHHSLTRDGDILRGHELLDDGAKASLSLRKLP